MLLQDETEKPRASHMDQWQDIATTERAVEQMTQAKPTPPMTRYKPRLGTNTNLNLLKPLHGKLEARYISKIYLG